MGFLIIFNRIIGRFTGGTALLGRILAHDLCSIEGLLERGAGYMNWESPDMKVLYSSVFLHSWTFTTDGDVG